MPKITKHRKAKMAFGDPANKRGAAESLPAPQLYMPCDKTGRRGRFRTLEFYVLISSDEIDTCSLSVWRPVGKNTVWGIDTEKAVKEYTAYLKRTFQCNDTVECIGFHTQRLVNDVQFIIDPIFSESFPGASLLGAVDQRGSIIEENLDAEDYLSPEEVVGCV
jgi:hypothetical protein